MLSAFTARPIVELKQRDKSKIETIVAHGDRIFVGLSTGSLRVYRLNELPSDQPPPDTTTTTTTSSTSPPQSDRPPSRSKKPTDLLREVEKFSTRSIDQLAVIKEANLIISLSNYLVHFHDLRTYEPIPTPTLTKTKNASCFAVTSNIVKDEDTDIPEIISRLAVAVKRRLYLWSWHESELSEEVGEVVLSESVRSVTWASATTIVCGMNGGYVMVDVRTGEVEDIVSPGTVSANGQGSRFGAVSSAGMGYMGLGGYMPKPLAAKLAEGEMLLAKDIHTLFVDDRGTPLERRQIPWASAPESIGYSYPYVLALQAPSKGSLEVRNPDTLSLLQNVSLPGAAQLHFPPPSVSLAHKGFHISSDRIVWKMQATDYDSQIQELVEKGSHDEAISVLGLLEDALLKNKTETLREVKMLKAEALFKKRRYRQALDLFNEDEVHAPPERVLKLYPPSIAGELSACKPKEGDTESVKSPRSSKKKTKASEPNSPEGSRPSSPQPGAFAKFLGGGRHKSAATDASSITSSKRDNDAEDTAGSSTDKEDSNDPHLLEGKELTNAVLELNSYLAGTRARLQRVIDPVTGKLKPQAERKSIDEDDADRFLRTSQNSEEKELEEQMRETFRLVDTTLFRAYMHSQPTLAGSLFRIPNFCDPEVVNEKLLENNRYTELIDFFHGKKLHSQALDLLRKFGSATKPDPKAPTLHGPDRTIQYLQNLPPTEIDLILEHAEWVLQANPEYAIEIFTGDTENAEGLPRERVVEFLKGVDSKLEGRYLEYVIEELGDMTPDLHNRLVELDIKNLKGMDKTEKGWDDLMGRFVKFLQGGEGGGERVYSMTKAFGMMPKDDPAFYEAQAIVLSNMGNHKQALEIFVFKMKNYHKAEEYCNRVHRSQDSAPSTQQPDEAEDDDDESKPGIYHTLLSLYLSPPSPHQQNLPPALDLLSKHGSRLPATSTLSLIPDSLPVDDLESYFRSRIRAANSLVNETKIVAGLRKAEGISVAARLHLGDGPGMMNLPSSGREPSLGGGGGGGTKGGRARYAVITEERVCSVCYKKFGGGGGRIGGTVVAVLPDGGVVHYGCLSRVMGKVGREEAVRAASWGRSS